MKYVITGSTGHISKPITEALVKSGHHVTVVTSKNDKKAEIEAMCAHVAVGSVEDRDFLTKTFSGADAAYIMIPPTVTATAWLAYQRKIADNYVAALQSANVKHIVQLSSIGADLRHGVGPVDGVAYLEEQMAKLKDANVSILRPSYFYYNLMGMIPMIKHMGFMGSTQPADFNILLTHPADIAAVAAELLQSLSFTGHEVKYIASDDTQTWTSITKTLGTAIGMPDLKYVEFTDEQSKQGMLQAGLIEDVAEQFMLMGRSLRSGQMQADYFKHKPAQLGKIKLADFAKDFAGAFAA